MVQLAKYFTANCCSTSFSPVDDLRQKENEKSVQDPRGSRARGCLTWQKVLSSIELQMCCSVASLFQMQRKKKWNDWKTCFPDVSVQSPLPDSRRRWILNKRILAMEDEAIAHFYVWSFKCFHVSPSGEEERAKHRGKRASSPQTLRWVSWLRSARRWTTTISRETNTSMHTLHTHLRAHTPGNIDYIGSKWAQTVTQDRSGSAGWLIALIRTSAQTSVTAFKLQLQFGSTLTSAVSQQKRVIWMYFVFAKGGAVPLAHWYHTVLYATRLEHKVQQRSQTLRVSDVILNSVTQFIQLWASWFSQTLKKLWHVFLKNTFLQSYDSQCF